MKRLSFVLFTMFLVFGAVSGYAQTFTTTMAGSREPAGGDLAGRGLAVITFNGSNVYYYLWVQGIASPSSAHIHGGLEGVSGGVLIGLSPTWTNVATNTYVASGSLAVDSGTTGPILQNPAGYYVNVHNSPFPNGAIRGQLLGDGPASFALATTLLGKREPSGGALSGQGFAALVFDSSTLYFYLWETGIAAPTAAHVHSGGAGVNGGVLVGLSPTFSNGQGSGNVSVGASTLAAIQANPSLYYVNIHNGDFPNGAIRGQLAATETDANLAVAAHNTGLGELLQDRHEGDEPHRRTGVGVRGVVPARRHQCDRPGGDGAIHHPRQRRGGVRRRRQLAVRDEQPRGDPAALRVPVRVHRTELQRPDRRRLGHVRPERARSRTRRRLDVGCADPQLQPAPGHRSRLPNQRGVLQPQPVLDRRDVQRPQP